LQQRQAKDHDVRGRIVGGRGLGGLRHGWGS
jgi:hypothetical protein